MIESGCWYLILWDLTVSREGERARCRRKRRRGRERKREKKRQTDREKETNRKETEVTQNKRDKIT